MRRTFRLFRLIAVVLGHTVMTWWVCRRAPASDRPARRADRQRLGCQRILNSIGLSVRQPVDWPEVNGHLLVCNHFALMDPFLLATEGRVAFVAKKEARSWPVAGWVAEEHGVIFVDRKRRTSTASFVEQVVDRLEHGVNVLVFPEGTTHGGYTIWPFKTGAFQAVANRTGHTVTPLFLEPVRVNGSVPTEGQREALLWADPSVSFGSHVWSLLRHRSVEYALRVGAPIPTDDKDRKELAALSESSVRQMREELYASREGVQLSTS